MTIIAIVASIRRFWQTLRTAWAKRQIRYSDVSIFQGRTCLAKVIFTSSSSQISILWNCEYGLLKKKYIVSPNTLTCGSPLFLGSALSTELRTVYRQSVPGIQLKSEARRTSELPPLGHPEPRQTWSDQEACKYSVSLERRQSCGDTMLQALDHVVSASEFYCLGEALRGWSWGKRCGIVSERYTDKGVSDVRTD